MNVIVLKRSVKYLLLRYEFLSFYFVTVENA